MPNIKWPVYHGQQHTQKFMNGNGEADTLLERSGTIYFKDSNVKIGIITCWIFVAHTTYVIKLREATNDAIGANLDQVIYGGKVLIVAAIKMLGKANAIHHFHAKTHTLIRKCKYIFINRHATMAPYNLGMDI